MKASSIAEEVTMKIVLLMDKVTSGDIETWLPLSGLAFNTVTGHTYASMNQLLLSLELYARNYSHNTWLTFRQINEQGGSVLKGEKASRIVFTEFLYLLNGQKIIPEDAKRHLKEAQRKDPAIRTYKEVGIILRPFLKVYHVFNTAQTRNLPERLLQPQLQCLTSIERDERIDAFIADYGITLVHVSANSTHYNPNADKIQMPFPEQFPSKERYYATLFHELVHSTGHPSRLNRTFGTRESEQYAFEELIAELGSAFLCAHFQIPAPLTSTTAYVKSWLQVLQNDKTYLLRAMKFSDAAMSYLIEKQTTSV